MQGIHARDLKKIVAAYDSVVIRAYCRIRFTILHKHFIRMIVQYLPDSGCVLDIGCGFGLFALAFAQARRNTQFQGFDLNSFRIAAARRASERLGIRNVHFFQVDAAHHTLTSELEGAYMLDIIHHIPAAAVRPLIESVHARLARPGSRLIIKDIARTPVVKRWFTWWVDKLMDYRAPVHYWDSEELMALLEDIGFRVYVHPILDYLPYPHVLYICEKIEKQ